MKTIKATLVMLPTLDKSANLMACVKSHVGNDSSGEKGVTKGELVYGVGKHSDNNYYQKQHLYATTSEEIKNGDVFINDDGIWCCNNDIIPTVLNPRKIVASTDKSLYHPKTIQYGNMILNDHNGDGSFYHCIDCEVEFSLSRDKLIQLGLIVPQISQSFIKQYAEVGGINEIEIECNTTCVGDLCSSTSKLSVQCISPVNCKFQKIKSDSNNCIIIYEIKNNFTRVELDNILSKFAETFVANADTAYKQKDIDDWKLKNI